MRKQRCTCTIAILFAMVGFNARGNDPKPNQQSLIGAVINLDQLNVGPLLLKRLQGQNGVTWLDHTAHHIASGSKPSSDQYRQADILVVLRAARGAGGLVVDMTVCETGQGLHLGHVRIESSADSSDDVPELEQEIRSALKKHQQQVTSLFAVTPFMNTGLSKSHQGLNWAYPYTINQYLLSLSGVFPIEIQCADAISRELALGAGQSIDRGNVRYLHGEFQVNQNAVELGVTQSDSKQSISQSSSNIAESMGELPEAVRKEIALDAQAELPEMAVIKSRIKKLASRAEWESVWTLAETGLLLEPADQELRRIAITALKHLSKTKWDRANHARQRVPGGYRPLLARALNDYRRQLDHTEICLRDSKQIAVLTDRLVRDNAPLFHPPRKAPGDMDWEFYDQLIQQEHDTFVRAVERQAKTGGEERLMYLFLRGRRPENRADFIQEIVLRLQDLDGATERTKKIIRYGLRPFVLSLSSAGKLLDALDQQGNAHVKAAVKELRAEAQRNEKQSLARRAEGRLPMRVDLALPGTPEVVFQPLQLRDPTGQTTSKLQGLVAAGNVDVVYRSNGIGIIDEHDSVEWLWQARRGSDYQLLHRTNGSWQAGHPIYDGRYVWAEVHSFHQPAQILVIDPLEKNVRQFSSEHGVPLPSATQLRNQRKVPVVTMAPLEPGRVCIACGASSDGKIPTWLATAELAPNLELYVDVFHTARTVRTSRDQWPDPGIAFKPMYMFTLNERRPDGEQDQRVVVGRMDIALWYHPLVIDPETLEVSVAKDEVGAGPERAFTAHDGLMYWCQMTAGRGSTSGNNPSLFAFGFPDFRTRVVASDFYRGRSQRHAIVFDRDKVHIVSNDWRTADQVDGPYRELRGEVPETDGIDVTKVFRSNRYGLVIKPDEANGLYRVIMMPDR